MPSGGKRGAGERVLESLHVIGLFLLMLLFSGVFFTLGYVMGRGQYDGQVTAATNPHSASDDIVRQNPGPKRSFGKTPAANTPPADTAIPAPPNSDWEFTKAGQPKTGEDRLQPPDAVPSRKALPAIATGGG